MRTKRNRILAWMAAGALILSLTLAGVIIHLGRFPGTVTAATTPRTTSTVPTGGQSQRLAPASPALTGSFGNQAASADRASDGRLQIRTSALKPFGARASISPNDGTRSANGSGRMD